MSGNGFDREQLLSLLSEVLDGTIDGAHREQLNDLLRKHPEARALYQEHMELHARLHLDYAQTGGLEAMPGLAGMPESPSQEHQDSPPRSNQWWMGIAAALAVGLFLNAFFLSQQDVPVSTSEVAEATNEVDGVAVLSTAVGVEWGSAEARFQPGDAMPAGRYPITSGLAQIEFFGGATVVVEGPAELELVSPQRAIFHHGRLRAFVPEPAQGFTIEGPDFDTVDLGTEFAMSVDTSGRSEVHVVDGEVELHGKSGGAFKNLLGGDGIRSTSAGGEVEEIESTGDNFVGRKELAQMAGEHWQGQTEKWEASRSKWKTDPDTLAYYDFEGHEAWDRQLRNAKPDGPGGAVVGAQWTQGRWPGKGALEFKRINDRIRLNVPGEFESLSLAAWVRIGGLDRWLSSLMLTDGWDPGEPHWQISDKGQIILGIRGLMNNYSEPIIGPQHLGKWLHLATVYDASAKLITHYVDGRPFSSKPVTNTIPVRIGMAEIGNWRHDNHGGSSKIRSFNGRMDEFLMLARALQGEEIEALYQSGTPNPTSR